MCDSQQFRFSRRLRSARLIVAGRGGCLTRGARTAGERKRFREERIGSATVGGRRARFSGALLLVLTRCRCREEHDRDESNNAAVCGWVLCGDAALAGRSGRFGCSGRQCRDLSIDSGRLLLRSRRMISIVTAAAGSTGPETSRTESDRSEASTESSTESSSDSSTGCADSTTATNSTADLLLMTAGQAGCQVCVDVIDRLQIEGERQRVEGPMRDGDVEVGICEIRVGVGTRWIEANGGQLRAGNRIDRVLRIDERLLHRSRWQFRWRLRSCLSWWSYGRGHEVATVLRRRRWL